MGKTIICRASFRGEITKQLFYSLIDYIDQMKEDGFVFENHYRTDLDNGNVKIDYSLILYSIDN